MELSREVLDTVLDLAADEVFLLRPDGSLKYANQSTLIRRGFSMDEMLTMAVWDWNSFVTESSWQRRWESLQQIKSARFESRHVDKNGESFPVDIQAHYLCFDNHEYCLCFVNDLSELAEKVNQLDKKHKELAVAKSRADEALKSLHDLQERRSLLFATIAHELRTPVAAISMLSSDDSAESWQDARNQVHQLARDLLHTLDDMRRLTQDNHKREVTSEQFNLQNLFESVQLSVSAYITRYRMKMQISASNNADLNEIWLYGDLYRLKVVLSNLVKNACVHSGGDQVNISVSRVESAEGEQQLTFRVEDNGRGIPADQVDHLFSAYARGVTDADGSGLGLHIARSWIEELGGTLRSIPSDGGAVFELVITLKSAKRSPADGVVEIGKTAIELSSVFTDTSKLSVLFVEDDKIIQMVGKKLLSKLFATVDIAGDGTQAVDKLEQRSYDLILTDYFMPNMNGLELIRQLRATGYTGIIYACSAATLGSEFNDLIDAGANDVFAKPLTLNKLMACLANDVEIFQQAKQPILDGKLRMEIKFATRDELLQQKSGRALLLIDMESGEIQGTEKWRQLNAVGAQQPLTRTLLNQTIPDESRDKYVSYSKQFFQSPVGNPPVVLDIKLCALDGREFMGRVTSEKVELEGRVVACTELEEI